jgi:deoxyribonuclease V
MWPADAESLIAYQEELATADSPAWHPEGPIRVGGCWVCFARGQTGPGSAGDPAWAAAVVLAGDETVDEAATRGSAGSPYRPGLLALRLGPLMEQAMRDLGSPPDVVVVDGTGRDHPRRAGLAVHLGAVLAVPTVGVTHRPLLARGEWPDDRRGASSPLRIDGEEVASWVRTRTGVRPLAVHPGWRVDLATAIDLVMACTVLRRTPEPLRRARQVARIRRAGVNRRTI